MYTNHELQATASGHVEDLPGSRKLYQLLLDDFRAKKRQGTIPELRAELRSLKIPTDGSAPRMNILDESNSSAGQRQDIQFESEPGVEIHGKLYLPRAAGRKLAVLIVADKTQTPWIPSTNSLAERMAKLGRVVLELEPRHSPEQIGNQGELFAGDWLTNVRADQIGRNMPAVRAHDILRGVDLLAARSDVDAASIRAAARGVKGVWLLLASASDPRIKKIWLDRTPYSLRAALESPMNTGLFDAVIPGFALHWDLDDLVKSMGKRPVLWTDPANWMGRVVALGPPFQYRYVLGDTTDLADAQDNAYLREFLR